VQAVDAPRLLQVRFGDFQIDEGNACLTRDGRPLAVQPKAFEVLCALARRPGQLVRKEELLDAVWGHQHVSESVLKTLVSHLRGLLADDARQPRYIETAARRGYRFIGTVADAPHETGAPASPAQPLPPMAGRESALAALHDALGAAMRGQPQVVFVAGEPGIGKTTLIDRFVAGLPAEKVVHAHAPCVEDYGSQEPYMPVLEALSALCRGAGGAPLVSLMRRVAPSWLAQLPWYLDDADRAQLQREVAGASQDRMLREMGELLDRCTPERPLLLVLEDLHWSDPATVRLIGYLARRRSTAAVMLLGSFRPAEVIATDHPLAGLRQELRLHKRCRELDLEALSETEVDALVAARLDGRHAPEAFVRALHAHTEGLPLFVVDIVDELLAEGGIPVDGDAAGFATGRFAVPRTLAGVVEKQITRLTPEQAVALGAASVAGAEFDHLVLAEALGIAPDAMQDALDAVVARRHWLSAAGVVTLPDGRHAAGYTFRHALYRHVFEQRLGTAQRMRLHRDIAAALLRLHGGRAAEHAAALAMHLERAGDAMAAVAQLAIVARRAMDRSAAPEALAAARRALDLLAAAPPGDPRDGIELDLRVLEGVAAARVHVISTPEVAATFERARALVDRVADSPGRARALHGLWWVHYTRADLAAARVLAGRLHALGRADASLAVAGDSTMGITAMMRGDLRAARVHLEAAVEAHGQGRDLPPGALFVQHPAVEAWSYLGPVLWWSGEPARARAAAARGVALAEEIRNPLALLIALHLAAVVHHFAHEPEPVRLLVERLFEVVRRHQLPTEPGSFSWLHGHALVRLGRVDEGLAEMQAAERSCRRLGLRIGLTGFHLHYAQACRQAGHGADALASVEAGLALADAAEERFLLSPLHRVRGELALDAGDTATAAPCLATALEVAQAQGARFHELAALSVACARAALSTPARRARLRELLAAYDGEDAPVVRDARALLAG
jgi:DNA-binding winged helix-turn-helix (wHTH) protein